MLTSSDDSVQNSPEFEDADFHVLQPGAELAAPLACSPPHFEAIPHLLPKYLCLSHKTSGCHCISCMPRRVWATAGCPFPKSAPVTPPLVAAGLSHGRDGLVCKVGLSTHRMGWRSHGQGSCPIPSPGQGPPELSAAVPTSPASCWNMFLKPSSMSSSVISSWGGAGQKEEDSGQTWALPCLQGSANPKGSQRKALLCPSLLCYFPHPHHLNLASPSPATVTSQTQAAISCLQLPLPSPRASAPTEPKQPLLPHLPDLPRSPRPAPWGQKEGNQSDEWSPQPAGCLRWENVPLLTDTGCPLARQGLTPCLTASQ